MQVQYVGDMNVQPNTPSTQADAAPRPAPTVFAAAFLLFFWTFVYDISIIPTSREHSFDYLIEIATGSGVVFLITVALVAMFKPAFIRKRNLNLFAVVCVVLGATFTYLGLLGQSGVFYVGMSLVDISFEWALVQACLGLSLLKPQQIAPYTAVAVSSAYILATLVALLPIDVAWVVFVGCPPAMIVVLQTRLKERFATICLGLPVRDVSVTQPSTWLPLTSKLFVGLFLFMGLFGYAVHFSPSDNGFAPALVALCIVAVLFSTVKLSFNIDLLYQIAALFMVFGLFMTPVAGTTVLQMHNVALVIAAICFYYLETLVVASLAARNINGGLSFIAWGNAVCLLGTIFGSLFKHLTDYLLLLYPQSSYVVTTLLVVVFVGYVLIALKPFSFQETIAQIDPSEKTSALSQEDLRLACQKVAAHYRLTQREAEIIEFLARGRNSIVIERELVISRNTIKTHVRHIYEKLGCHNQQQLIDVIEDTGTAGG